MITHHPGDGILILEQMPSKSINLLLTDPPYSFLTSTNYVKPCTANPWDKPVDWPRFWACAFDRVIDNGAIVIFGNPPFSFELLNNPIARKYYRYDWIWQKERGSNFQHANRQPMKVHEHIHVFYKKQPTYNPIKTDLDQVLVVKPKIRTKKTDGLVSSSAALYHPGGTYVGKFPTTILKFPRDRPMIHPAAKPWKLCEYLIKTYTNPGDMVFDPFSGSATVGYASAVLGDRDCVMAELDPEWFLRGQERIQTYNDLQKTG